jgi:type IV pilus assembly protein PilY1
MNDVHTDWLGTIRQTFTKALVLLLCSLNAMPAWSAGSTLYQEPPFTSTEPPANVFMMLDDSYSMAGHSLPIPASITIKENVAVTVEIKGAGADASGQWGERSWKIDRDNDWLLRAPALNPLWYNPANRYVPWNKDGTRMPNASIGGNVATTNYGAFTSRANAAQLTERDPRQVPDGSNFKSLRPDPDSINTGAGRGLLGTDSSSQTDAVTPITQGRRVTLGSFADFRYNKIPFDFGPSLPGAVSAPRNGHADQTWTTHHDTTSPLDLFSRPLQPTNSTNISGCFKDVATCLSGVPASEKVSTNTFKQTDCNNIVQPYTGKPADLTCWKRTECNGQVKYYSNRPDDQICGYSWIDCAGVAQNNKPNPPATLSCPRRIQNCNGSWTNDPQVNSLTCYATRTSCGNTGFGAWSSTQTNPPDCWSQATCSGSTQYSSGSKPANIQCKYSQQNCNGSFSQYDSPPPPLTCYQQTSCAGVTTISATKPDPETLSCGYSRTNCGASTPTTYTMEQGNPGDLNCNWRRNCDGTNTGWTATVLQPLTCPSATEQQPRYEVSTQKNPSSLIQNGTLKLPDRTYSGGSLLQPQQVTMTQKQDRTALSASMITVNSITAKAEKDIRGSTQSDPTCPANTSPQTCTIPAVPGVPDPAALTPARYYRYTGGDKGLPTSYKVVQIDRTRPAGDLYPVIDATTGVAATPTTSQRSDCADNTKCTWLEEAQNYANWYLYYRNRLFAAQAVVADSLSSMTSNGQQKLRLGYGRINYFEGAFNPWLTQQQPLKPISNLPKIDGETNPGALVRGVRPFVAGTQDRSDFFNWLFSLAWVGSTPNREAIDSVGRYFARSDNKGPWGATPGTEDKSPQLACRRNSLFLTTDGEWTNAAAGQPLIGATGPDKMTGNGGPQESDNVDGPTITGDGVNAGATFTYKPSNWMQFTGDTSQSQTLTDAAVYYWNHDLRPDLPNVILPVTDSLRPNPAFWQSMSTYIIGYGLSASMDTVATRAAVTNGTKVAWPSVDLTSTLSSGGNRVNDSMRAALASRGNFYAAQTVAELKSGVLGSFLEIATRQGSAGGVAVTGPAITDGSQAFFPSYTTGKWTGALKAYKSADLEKLAQGNVVTPDWTASLPAFGARNILSSRARKSAIAFDVTSLDDSQKSSLTSTAAGFSYTAAEAVNYLRGDQSLELPSAGISAGTKFRRRESLLGDIVNSTPLYVKAPDYGYAAMSTVGASYGAYVKARRDGTVATVYVGANDGMFHAFDAKTGVERFAYVPRGVYPTLANLLNPGYEHNYYVDGPVTAGDWHNGSWRSIVIGTSGAGGANGGSSVFAIDVTNPASITPSSVKWDIKAADSDHLGHILNRGIVGRIKTAGGGTKWVYMVGNGYESTSNMAALLVVDVDTGDMTAIPLGKAWNGVDADRNGMGGITALYDSERNIKLVYGGDRQGNLWRFDFSSGIPSGAKGFGDDKALFSTGTSTRAITAAPRLVPHPLGGMLIVFGTGKLHDTTDGIDTASQGIYAIWDKPQYASSTIMPAKLKSLTVSTANDATRTIDTSLDWNSFMGWSAQLTGGERVISDPTADAGSLTVTSYAPSAALDPCNGGGVSYVYRFNFATGIITAMQVTGVVGAVTPLTIAPTSIARTDSAGVNISSGISSAASGSGTGTRPPASLAQCRLYSTSIQGRPNVIAVNCPNFSPIRVWRQQLR